MLKWISSKWSDIVYKANMRLMEKERVRVMYANRRHRSKLKTSRRKTRETYQAVNVFDDISDCHLSGGHPLTSSDEVHIYIERGKMLISTHESQHTLDHSHFILHR